MKKNAIFAARFGLFGLGVMLLGLIVALLEFNLLFSHSFNFLNHTLSELGTYGHTTFAVVLNGGLFFGSLCVVFFCLSSLQHLPSLWGYPFFLSLALTFLALAAVGLFPVNIYHLHILGLKWFFSFGCVSALYYLLLAWLDRRNLAPWTCLWALLVLLSMATFLLAPQLDLELTLGDRPFYHEMVVQFPRPALWWPALLEWLGLASLLLWTATILLNQLRQCRGDSRQP
ncbi:MAG: hypothetical protein ACRDBI_08700 [Shewanella sp.]